MRKGTLFVITAPSGAGKTTLIDIVLRSLDTIEFSVSCTTRSRRKGEIDGKDYHFINVNTFQKVRRAGGFLEWARVFDDYYGTPKKETEKILEEGKDIILDIDVQGASQIRKKKKDAVFIFILPPDYKTLTKRLEKRRSDPKAEIGKRLMTARKDAKEFRKFDYIVVNDKVEKAAKELKGIFFAERAKVSRCFQAAARIVKTFQ